jgi:tRNA dimethylallyltransferase
MNPDRKPRIVAIVGCTGGGKTALAVELAKRHGGEVISCDSMQIYKGMDIGTAKPTADEIQGIPHWMLDVADPLDGGSYSCADYVKEARQVAADVLSRGRLPILCGGTGLYLDAFLRGGCFEETVVDTTMREELYALAEREGAVALHRMLCQVDPESGAVIHPNNVKRVVRAIEIFRTTGRKKSDLDRESREPESMYDAVVIGIRYGSRELLNRRIDVRVDAMLAAGLVDETKRLRDLGVFERCATAAQAIGYKELFGYLDGIESLEEAVGRLKIATHQYAKRQMTWFSAKPYVRWVDADEDGKQREFEDIVNNAEKLF